MKDITNARFYIDTGVLFESPMLEGAHEYTAVEYSFYMRRGFKLHLRPLSDMSQEEKSEWFLQWNYKAPTAGDFIYMRGSQMLWLISKGFDLGLLPDENIKLVSSHLTDEDMHNDIDYPRT